MSPGRVQRIDVVVDQGHDFATVVSGLRARGMRVEHALSVVGVVVGTVAPEYLAAIESAPGVKKVVASEAVQVSRGDEQSNATSA